MPRCEGRPESVESTCPSKANNASVKLRHGDLMLCKDCEQGRFPDTSVKCTEPKLVIK